MQRRRDSICHTPWGSPSRKHGGMRVIAIAELNDQVNWTDCL